jgi:hypothetical protein
MTMGPNLSQSLLQLLACDLLPGSLQNWRDFLRTPELVRSITNLAHAVNRTFEDAVISLMIDQPSVDFPDFSQITAA